MRMVWTALVLVVFIGVTFAQDVSFTDGPPQKSGKQPPAGDKWNSAEYVFTAKLEEAIAGPMAMSYPPIYSHTLAMTVEKVLRGAIKPGDKIEAHHSARQEKQPTFPVGKMCLVAASKAQGTMVVEMIEQATKEKLAKVTMATAIPLGWKIENDTAISPWAPLGKKAWTAEMADTQNKVLCEKTGRPALKAGPEVKFAVSALPPVKAIQWTNPDGDGLYKITVSNPTDKPITVPALLSQDGKILWEESLVILCQERAYPCPGAKGVSGKIEATKLEPGQSVSTTINTLLLKGPEWPQGGYRIEFRFCLGEKSETKSLYYMSRHHDKLRSAALKANP